MKETPLCKIAYKHKTDKCPRIRHFYTPFYYELLKNKPIKKVLEMGIGTMETMGHVSKYKIGASLYMWQEFFPEAQIFGADISPKAMIRGKRIKTYICDETDEKQIKRLVNKVGSDVDLFIDDASHFVSHQIYLAKTILPLLKKDVIYIIEDVGMPDHVKKALIDYDCHVPRLPYKNYKQSHVSKDRLLVVKNK